MAVLDIGVEQSAKAQRKVDIPLMQWAQSYEDTGSALEYKAIPVPEIAPHEVLVQIKFSGVCHTDLHAWKGDWPIKTKKNLVGGHEGAGVVVKRGSKVTSVSIGDRVGVQWMNSTCGECEFCCNGDGPLCLTAKCSGYHVDGTFQQFCVCKAANVVRIPDDIPLEVAAPILCAGVTVYKALKELRLKPGQIVAIAGAGGGSGSLACQYAKALGYRVLALSAGPIKKAMLTEELQVDFFVDYAISEDLVLEVQQLTAGGPHASLVVASVEAPLNQAIQYVRSGGTVVAIGLPKGALIKADVISTAMRKITIKGAYVGTAAETEEALEVYAQKRFDVKYRVCALKELPTVFESMEQGNITGRVVLEMPTIHQDANGQKAQKAQNGLNGLNGTHSQLATRSMFTQSQYNLGTFLAYRLEELGVNDYFVVPGDYNLSLLDQILKNPNLKMVGCCNELNAGYAADGYARSSPAKVAVVFVTFMVGGLSLLNAIAGAYSDRLRVIVVSGAPPEGSGQDAIFHHTIGLTNKDQAMRMFEQVTTFSVRLDGKSDPASLIDRAFVRCLEDSLPVYIEMPSDLVEYKCNPPTPLTLTSCQRSPESQLLTAFNKIRNVWSTAQKPVILIGALARHFLPANILLSLVEKLGCPVYCQPDAKSLLPESHPQFRGTYWGVASDPACLETMMGSDLWMVLGGRWSDYHTLKGPSLKGSNQILDLQADRVRVPDGSLIESVTMAEIAVIMIESNLRRRSVEIGGHVSDTHPQIDALKLQNMTNTPLTVTDILAGIQSLLRPGDTLIAETGDSWFNAQKILLPDGADYQMQMMYGSIGWSLPATLGCQLARPEGRAVLMIGDGSFQMTAQELSTMIRLRTTPIIVIFNNLGYRIETAIHDGPYNYISNWNYSLFASTMCSVTHSVDNGNVYLTAQEKREQDSPSIFAMRIKTQTELAVAIDRLQEEPEKLAILECCIHPSDISDNLFRFGQVEAFSFHIVTPRAAVHSEDVSRIEALAADDLGFGVAGRSSSIGIYGSATHIKSPFGAEWSRHGTDIIMRGGNAADAMVATMLCVGVIGMYHSGIGGGGFMLIRSPEGVFEFVDFREPAPAAAFEEMFNNNTNAAVYGGLASGVPGELRGLEYLHAKYGSLPWSVVVQPAIQTARYGFPVGADLVHYMDSAVGSGEDFLVEDPSWAIDFAPHGTRVKQGDIMTRKRYANTLEAIANNGADAFYEGHIAETMIQALRAANGTMTLEDLRNYTVAIREVAQIDYRGFQVASSTAPSSGVIALNILKVLDTYDPLFTADNVNLSTHRMDEAIRFGYGLRTNLGDPLFVKGMDEYQKKILEMSTISEIRAKISDLTTQNVSVYDPAGIESLETPGTSHITTIDHSGLAVSAITTINLLFGNQIMVPETGIIMNNEMDDFSIPGSSNSFGYVPSEANFIRPGKRPLSSCTPAMVTHPNGTVFFVTGSAGGSRIITATVQNIIHAVDEGLSAAEILAKPRLHDQLIPNQVAFEYAYDNSTVAFMKSRGHNVTWMEPGTSTAQAIRVLPNGTFDAAGEPRQLDSGGFSV
ncbi:hypothetical protein AOCH_004258 [Aspergillus ochraceoroseus]|uniref:Glutathione hydrolase n=1 Tax=Aspergillus ochraceoroseus TaxID=138278 RepID=A0A0F8U6B2_9EURO|nr:hypothetical protein AOCH_004258 [Aspergillus ochraceoroseus]